MDPQDALAADLFKRIQELQKENEAKKAKKDDDDDDDDDGSTPQRALARV